MDTNERAKELRRAYQREWNKRNRDKVRARNQRYWAKKAAEAEQREREEVTHHETDQP